jgi:4-alpha-glucanotransferase
MDRAELVRRAQAAGVAVSYQDWRGRQVEVGTETLAAVMAAIGDGQDQAEQTPPEIGDDGGPAAPVPDGRSWGFTVQLYSLRSRGSWGHGDLRDLAELATWSARDLGAGFVLCSPLHAAEPAPPVSASPYMPMSRRFTSPLYLRIEDIPEYAALPRGDRERIDRLAQPLRERNHTAGLIDRDAVWTAKRAALEIIWAGPEDPQRRAGCERFLAGQGRALEDWATWCALAEQHGPDWREWPARLRDPRSAAVTAERARLAGRVGFHAWLQWLAAGQRAAAQQAARAAGMRIGIIHDLAVGAHPGGADAWAGQDVFAQGVTVGAPPDEFNPLGQDWALPPWHPGRLAGLGYRPLAGLIDATLADAGGIRADHVMGLFRLWWVPAGMTPDQGTYVRYPHKAMTGVLASRAARWDAIAVGEDLGTVEPWIRRDLSARGVLGTSMLWFERDADGAPLPPERWRRDCLATVGTHDVPPAASFVTGEHVALRARLGLLGRPEDAERAEAAAAIEAWRAALVREGLLPSAESAGPGQADPAEFTAALYGYLARTPALLIGVSLADAAGEHRPQNLPGTSTEYPNWQIPLAGPDGAPVLAEDLPSHAEVLAVAAAVTGRPDGVTGQPAGPAAGSAARGRPRPGSR